MLERIGQGGMGTIWRAEHVMLGRRAALKLLHPMYTAQPEMVTRFFNEARAAAAIADPGIVQIFDFGHHTDGSAYIAMELLEGEPLDQRLERLVQLPVAEALRILRQVASTLGVTHALGIVHRDLKPENIFLVPDPEVPGGERSKILDFGIAKLTGDPTLKTNASAVMGTPAYMSPEQCRGAGHVDQRADVYAVGCILFELLTGRRPFQAEGAGELIAKHLLETPPAPSSLADDLSPEIDALVLRCLDKDPAQRFASGAELAVELGRLLGAPAPPASSHMHRRGPERSLPRRPVISPTTLSLSSHTATRRTISSSRRIVYVALGVLVAGSAVAAGAMTIGGDAPEGEPRRAAASASPPAPAPEESAAVAPPAPAPPAAPDPAVVVTEQMKTVLTAFVEWSRAHPGEPCPSISALGEVPIDPWGAPLVLTCTDQPANQIAGVVSAGPDATLSTADDRGSWQLPPEATAMVQGPRWAAAAATPAAPAPARRTKKKRRTLSDDIPSER